MVGKAHLRLVEALRLPPEDLPRGGDWHPSTQLQEVVVKHIAEAAPAKAVALGATLAAAVIARAMALAGKGQLWVVEHDLGFLEALHIDAARLGAEARILGIEAPLEPYDGGDYWYDRGALRTLPPSFGLLLVGGPPPHCGRVPRGPAGRELFRRVNPGGAIFMGDYGRAKDRRAAEIWGQNFPEFRQTVLKGGTVLRLDPPGDAA